MENLQLLCPKCNLTRKKHFTFEEILDFPEHGDASDNVIDCGELRRVAASCGEPPRVAASRGLNPIQSNPIQNTNTNTKGNTRTRETPPTLEEVKDYCRERNSPVDPVKFWEYFNAGGWKDAKGQPVRSWKQKLLTWEKYDTPATKQAREKTFADMYREMTENDEG